MSEIITTNHCFLILIFDGNLFCYDTEKNEIALIDSDVTDICNFNYIKNNQCFSIGIDTKIRLITSEQTPLLSLTAVNGEILLTTKDNLLLFNYHGGNLGHYQFSSKNIIRANEFIVQDINDDLYDYSHIFAGSRKIKSPKVKEIFQDFVRLENGDIALTNYYSYFIKFNNICCTSNNLQESIRCNGEHLLLINNNLYLLSGDLQTSSLVHSNVKAIGKSSTVHNGNYIIF